MYKVSNDLVSLVIDEMGNLVELKNISTGHNYANSNPLWRLIAQRGPDLEYLIAPDQTKPVIATSEDTLSIKYDSLKTTDEELKIACEIIAKLDGDEVRWNIELSNEQEDITIRECFFPMIYDCKLADDQSLIWSENGGKKIDEPLKEIQSCHTNYMGQDEYGVVMMSMYPGVWMTMNYYLFAGEDEGLYIASHDESIQQTMHYLRLVEEKKLEAGLVKYPFLKPGQRIRIDGYVTSPYSGSWHGAAEKYRSWLDTAVPFSADPPEWMNDFNGWQRVIMRHQYGKVLFGYDQIEQMYNDGVPAGIDGLFLFGWYAEGHDAGYPDYLFDETQGGKEVLREGIQKVKAAGGKVILYFNGHLIENGGDFYKKVGHKICSKNERGLPYTEEYRFSGEGTIQRQFGNRFFVQACPACEQWFEHLKGLCDIAIDLDVDCVFFDQFGGWDNVLCFDESHGHPVPFTTIGKAKIDLLERLYAYVKSQKPEMGFGTEILVDGTARKVDFVHTLEGGMNKGGFSELCRYTFSELTFTYRGIRDDKDIPRRCNNGLLNGLISDVEIYRCRNTIAETPIYSAYLAEVNRLRKKYARLILQGTYRHTQGVEINSDKLDYTRFDSGDETAILLTHNNEQEITATVSLPGYSLVESDGLGEFDVQNIGTDCLVKLQNQSLAVCVFKKNKL